MSSTTILIDDPEQVRLLLGPQDSYLRRIRDALGARVVLRGNELTLEGTDEQVSRSVAVFEELREVIARNGSLEDAAVGRAIDHSRFDHTAQDSGVHLFDRARLVTPRTPGQADYINSIRQHDLVLCCGPAGCGKTYLAVAMALNALRQELVRKIVLVRPAVEAGEKLGFLPGDMLAKVNPFLRPLLDALSDLSDFEQVRRYMENDVVEIIPLAFMRGRTLNETFIILDEAQNSTVTQMKMFLTRMGEGSKIVVTGDVTQVDLPTHVTSGLTDAMQRLRRVEGVGVVELTGRDIVRHRLVRDIVDAYEGKAVGRRSAP
jgi:phosphate starvation-inducible PhoH-like protein